MARADFGDVLPLDDVDSSDIDLAGRFAELVDRLDAAQELMAGTRTAAEWADGLLDAVLALAGTAAARDAWQQMQLRGELADVADGRRRQHRAHARSPTSAPLLRRRARRAARPGRASAPAR